MKTTKLLLVEDDPTFCYMVKGGLEDLIGGYEIFIANNGKEGYEMWKKNQPDVIVADIEMPVMNGYELVRKIRETDSTIPILFISSRVSAKDVIKGYDIGVNNYIRKPCLPEELHAHIQGTLKTALHVAFHDESCLQKLGSFTLDAKHGLLKRELREPIKLTATEAQILQVLCAQKGEIIRREDIQEMIWNTSEKDFFVSRRLDTFISKLRDKLKDDPSVEIKVFKGIGLSLVD